MSDWPRVAVVGGSLGGLTAALVLRDLGCEVDVYERSTAELEARGAGIGLHPMTVRYFEEHDPLDMERVVITLPWLRFLNRDGRTRHEERMNYQFSSWNTIYRSLLTNFGEGRYHLGREMVSFDQDADGVAIHFADGGTETAELLVCADGIASQARTTLLPDARPRYAGYVAWRGTVPESALERATFERLADAITYCLMGSGHILVYAIPSLIGALTPGQRLQNFVWYHNYDETTELPELLTDREGRLRELSVPPGMMHDEHITWTREFATEHMAPEVAEVVRKTRHPFIQVVYDIEVDRMAFGRVCLIGDGAFAVRPHAAAGTAKACADAWALRDALEASNGEVAATLEAWEPGQLELGRALLARTRWIGDGSQFRHDWVPGDPRLRFGLYGPGR